MSHRVIAVLGKTTPYRPGLTIIDAFEFDFDHLFDFFDNTKNWINSKVRYKLNTDLGGDEGIADLKKIILRPATREVKTSGAYNQEPTDKERCKKSQSPPSFHKPRQKMLFLFDYGDEWQFIAELKKITEPEPNKKSPSILESFGSHQSSILITKKSWKKNLKSEHAQTLSILNLVSISSKSFYRFVSIENEFQTKSFC